MDYGNEPRFPAWVSKSTKKIHTSAGAGESLQQYVRKICNMGMVQNTFYSQVDILCAEKLYIEPVFLYLSFSFNSIQYALFPNCKQVPIC